LYYNFTTLPPAATIASSAALENACASTSSLAVNDVVFMHLKDNDLSAAENGVDDYIYGIIGFLYKQQVEDKK
jgi:hypothetical protein